MAVIEYMLIKDGHKRQVPDFVGDRGYWMSPIDNSFVGWVDDVRDYYVPDTIVTLTREAFITRQLAIHAHTPMRRPSDIALGPLSEKVDMTNEEVTAQAQAWYDEFVTKNSA